MKRMVPIAVLVAGGLDSGLPIGGLPARLLTAKSSTSLAPVALFQLGPADSAAKALGSAQGRGASPASSADLKVSKVRFGPEVERTVRLDKGSEARLTSRRASSLASLAAIPALLLIGLASLVAGGLWMGFGVKSGAALGRGALVLALAGIWLGLLVGLALHLFNMRGGLFGYGLFLACEMGAFVLGWLARRETPGKAARIVAAVLMLGSLLFLS